MPRSVALLSPVPLASPVGNAVTVTRIARGLRISGLDVRVWDAEATDAALLADAGRSRPQIVHAFHARRSGPRGRALAGASGAALVVTLTGTDVSDDLASPARWPAVRDVLRAAAAVTVFHESVASVVRAALPELEPRLSVVPQSVALEAPSSGGTTAAVSGDPCILFPAGIRPVKRPRLPLGPLDALARQRPDTRLWYVGPALDRQELERLLQALEGRPWARYLGAVPHPAMPALLGEADIVLNCSASEGGMANAVLEALALGRAVLAADIPGNRSLVEDGVTGLLFGSGGELADHAGRLAADPALRRRLGEAGRCLVASRFTPAVETAGYLGVYAQAIGERQPA
jgi:hypothetical protein